MRLAGALLCAAALALAPACAAQPAGGAGEVAATAIPWPVRAATVVRDLEVGPWTLRWVGPYGLLDLEPDDSDAATIAVELGVDQGRIDFEGLGSIVVRMPEGEVSKTARVAGKPVAGYEVLTADARGEGAGAGYQLQRTWFVLYEPRGEAVGATAVVLPGMFGTPEPVIDTMVGKLRDRGWHVLRLLTHSSRFTEKRSYELDPADPSALAAVIAGEFGDRTAENALALEAVCAHIASARPETPIGVRVAVGMSGGGMILPTVLARERGAYRAAVYIGAGCDYAAIAMESNYSDWIDAVRVTWAGDPDGAARAAFREAYRAAAALDGYQTAPAVADIPTLMLHGEHDMAVPAALGDLLWERLGQPERWSVQATHETLFLAYLPGKIGDVLDWMGGRLGQ